MKLVAVSIVASLALSPTLPAADMKGSGDHPSIPRVSGSEIYGYAHAGYDAGAFVQAVEERELVPANPQGERTRILYVAKPGDTPLMIQKNYETALDDLGRVEEMYSCRDRACPSKLSSFLWSRETMTETQALSHPFYLIAFAHNYKTPAYRYVRVDKGDAVYHVSVFSATIADNNPNESVRGRTIALVEVLETRAFQATLEFVDAAEMKSEIDSRGHVALYGIHFDTDKATLRAESEETITEIVKALKAHPDLSIYVVGHTDGVGALEYNQDLSERRARTVVEALAAKGIERTRLTPLGVGPAAPVATNDSDEGRALNRRVELVKR